MKIPSRDCTKAGGFHVHCVVFQILWSLSKGVLERSTATGNEAFSLFARLGATAFVILSVVTFIETIYLNIRARPLPKNEKRSRLPYVAQKRLCLSSLCPFITWPFFLKLSCDFIKR